MRRRRSVDPDAARRLARQTLTRLARLRDATGHDIHETAQQAYDLGLTWQEIGECLGRTAARTTSPTNTTRTTQSAESQRRNYVHEI